MGGHLLRLGCGFSLFQRMMIWNKGVFHRAQKQTIASINSCCCRSQHQSFLAMVDNIQFQLVNWFSPEALHTCEQYLDLETTWSSFMIG